jgi:hypothetical protein
MAEKNTPEVTTVKMDDGRLVEFAGKKQLLKDSFIDADGTVKLRLDWRNGETRTYTLNPQLLHKFAAHGAEQKFGDEIAGLKKADGTDADIEDKVLALDELHDRLTAGEWNSRKESSGMAGTSILIRALVELYQLPVPKIKEFLKDKTQAEKLALRGNPKVAPIVAKLESERTAKSTTKVDSEALLAGLEG